MFMAVVVYDLMDLARSRMQTVEWVGYSSGHGRAVSEWSGEQVGSVHLQNQFDLCLRGLRRRPETTEAVLKVSNASGVSRGTKKM